MKLRQSFMFAVAFCATLVTSGFSPAGYAAPLNLASKPLFLGATAPPLLMLVMGRDHKLYYEAYNDASDLNNDGVVDVGYKPDIDYYGYFNSYACYDYSTSLKRFVPKSVKSAADKAAGIKTCNAGSGSSAEYPGSWSGDFLNYVTTARIDALRKVFYGGYRSTDTSSLTVLERTHIPQDAHTWAKEYRSFADDGYYIDEVTPLAQPPVGKGHLFGNVSFSVGGDPLMRVLPNTRFRPWQWASIERPVLGNECVEGISNTRVNCETSSGDSSWPLAEKELFSGLTRSYYRLPSSAGNPADASGFDSLVSNYEKASNLIEGPTSIDTIEGGLGQDHYMSIVRGNLVIKASGDYTFSVNGDDAVEFIIKSAGSTKARIGWYGGHSDCSDVSCRSTHAKTVYLTAGSYPVEFRHEENTGGDNFELYRKIESADSTFTEYTVRNEVCKSASLLEDNCKTYSDGDGNTSYKPTGLLHDYGENNSILFGLMTGSYASNLDGGVLRKVVSSFQNEVNSDDGTFTDANGIVGTIDKLHTVNFNNTGSSKTIKGKNTDSYSYRCGRKTTGPISNGECEMWGNPIAEMMYETVRYFSGKNAPTSDFDIADSGNTDADLGLPHPDWNDPYNASTGQPYCANPYMMVVSDINPSYDSDKVPGSYFSSFSGDVSGLNVSDLSNTITSNEAEVPGLHYIGQSKDVSDNAPTAKNVESLASIRGLAPEEPTKLGSYYSAAIAYYGWLTDLFPTIGSADSPTRINTFAVALASPLPRINIPIPGGSNITLVPFAKSPGGNGISAAKSAFQPTDQIVDFYIENLTANEGSFLINFEDVEQGADHDMDAIARYQYKLNADNTVTITVDSLYAAGGIDQHMGYVISGTSKDGVYLVVHDRGGSVPIYYLDRPDGVDAGDPRGTEKLTLTSTRTFTPSGAAAATLLKDPLFYAAKWGGFVDKNDNNIPDLPEEWDSKNNITQASASDGVPDNYFQVTNALGLKDQLSTAFNNILEREASSSTVTVNSGALNTDTLLFQAIFNAGDWSGNVFAYPVESDGVGLPVWDLRSVLKNQLSGATGFDTKREVITYNPTTGTGVPFRWPADPDAPTSSEISSVQVDALRGGVTTAPDVYGAGVLNYIRGDQSQEGAGTTLAFRERDTVLGDIGNSDPLFVPRPGFFYPDNWAGSAPEDSKPYSAFRSALKNRDPVLYFGGNDGMFHAINAYKNNADASKGTVHSDGGEELLAYVPSKMYGKLGDLTNPNYTHEYFVDGPSTYGDVFFGSKWHTALVGTLRAGGQGLFALDITDPKGILGSGYPTFDEADADSLVLWEMTDANDADLGYTFGKPVIVRMNNGKWAAIVANGYNNTASDSNVSSTGDAVLYVIDIETGNIIRKLDTGFGAADDPESLSRPNGLASPAVADFDGDYIADAVYAGDLFGNMWKFDVSASDPANWKVSFGTVADPQPLFVAKDSAGHRLPITSRPAIGSHPDPVEGKGDVLVYFGTGKYFESNDNDPSDQNTQSFFAVWDDGTNSANRGNMLQQKILKEATSGDYEYRLVSDNEIHWKDDPDADPKVERDHGWFIDLVNTDAGNTNNYGERVVYEPIIRNDRIIFTTLIPSLDQCSAGGSGWLMELSAISGARLDESPFDTNNDDKFNSDDLIDFGGDDKKPAGGTRKKGGDDDGSGIPTPPVVLDNPPGDDGTLSENKYTGTSKAKIDVIKESSSAASQGRQNWREVN